MNKTEPAWRQYEVAVSQLIAALGPTTEVTHDVKLPDEHTGRMRQRDVWIETKLLGHFPIKILVSCKHTNASPNEQDIDHFNGEFISSGAHKGIVYSLSTFNAPALEKAETLGFCCCQLYKNEPPKIPDCLIVEMYYFTPQVIFTLLDPADPRWKCTTWGDVFRLTLDSADGSTTVLDSIVELYSQCQTSACSKNKEDGFFPPAWSQELSVTSDEDDRDDLMIRLYGSWKVYSGNIEAYLLEGSYNVTTGEFIGKQIGPVIDTWSAHPGPGWTEIKKRPVSKPPMRSGIFKMVDARSAFIKHFSETPLAK